MKPALIPNESASAMESQPTQRKALCVRMFHADREDLDERLYALVGETSVASTSTADETGQHVGGPSERCTPITGRNVPRACNQRHSLTQNVSQKEQSHRSRHAKRWLKFGSWCSRSCQGCSEQIRYFSANACAADRGPSSWQARNEPQHSSGQPSDNRPADPTSRGTLPGSCRSACAGDASAT